MMYEGNTGYTDDEKQFLANWAQMVTDDLSVIVPVTKYNVSQDNRLLIPILSHHKIGFVNQKAEYIIEPKYDRVWGEVKDSSDVILVGIRYSYGLPGWREGQILTYERFKWGIIDANGKQLFDTKYQSISVSDDRQYFTLHTYTGEYYVCDREGKVIVDSGVFDYIDGFSKGFARVKVGHTTNSKTDSNCKWGIINTNGEIVLPVEYDNIWNFAGKNRNSTRVEKGTNIHEVFFSDLLGQEENSEDSCYDSYYDYGSHYGAYAGSYAQDVMGYSDDVINDAFEGDPDAYWNID